MRKTTAGIVFLMIDHQNSRGLVVLKALSPPPKPSAEGFLFMKAT